MASPSATQNSYPYRSQPISSKSGKAIARKAFDAALDQKLHQAIQEAKRMAYEIEQSSDLWDLELHLTQRRKEIDYKYDLRGSRLIDVFGRFLYKGPGRRGAVAQPAARQAEIHLFVRQIPGGSSRRRMIGGMSRALANLAGTISMLLTTLLWLCLLDAGRADYIADNLAGFRNEYRVVLGAGLLAVVLGFVAAIHAAKWWYVAVMCSLGTLALFTYALSR